MTEPLPCPFCGHVGVTHHEGSTFRWLTTECNGCGAQCGEERIDTLSTDQGAAIEQAKEAALKSWNTRFAPFSPQQQAEPVSHAAIAGALFDFMGWLTTRKERLVLSSTDNASPAVESITEFAKMRGLSLDDAKVQDWNTSLPQQQAEPPTCAWSPEDDDFMPGTYRSGCGELWAFIDGGWKDNRVNFCHGCGGKVVEAAHNIQEPKIEAKLRSKNNE